MKRYLLIILIFNVLNGQSKPFDSFNVIIYPEYYFEGIMAELEAEIKESDLPLNLKMTVPVNADSIFFVSGDNPNEPDVKILSIKKENDRSFVNIDILDKKFRLFIFYDLIKNNDKRSGSFIFELNHSIDDAHIILQEPLIAEDFIFPEKDIESFKDQHGINFKRIHLNNYKANTNKTISFNYSNPSGDISINKLQTILSDNGQSPLPPTESTSSSSIVPPLRHKLPSWQPLLVLSVVAVVVGWMYSHQSKNEKSIPLKVSKQKKGKFCAQCGSPVKLKDKFCSNCGGEL